jgi:hypothetical protein
VADFNHIKMPDDSVRGVATGVSTSGFMYLGKRLLGADGAVATGVGDWFRTNAARKTFFLYPQDRKTAAHLVGASVEIQACMELPDAVADHDAAYKAVLATLTPGSPSFVTEGLWRYVRAEVKAAGAGAIQVGVNVQG